MITIVLMGYSIKSEYITLRNLRYASMVMYFMHMFFIFVYIFNIVQFVEIRDYGLGCFWFTLISTSFVAFIYIVIKNHRPKPAIFGSNISKSEI